MSLITEALELQAQKKPRTIRYDSLPPFSDEMPRNWLKTLLWSVGLGLVILAGVWQGPVLWNLAGQAFGTKSPPKKNIPAEPVVPAIKSEAGLPLSQNPPEPVGRMVMKPNLPVESKAIPEVTPKTEEAPVHESIVVPFHTADQEDATKVAEKLRERREKVIRGLTIQGVRMQGKDSRALIDGNPVAVGEALGVEGLKLKSIDSSNLIFEDPDGADYTKSY